MRGSLNFLSVHSCSQSLPLISCIYASNFQRRLTLLCLISISGVKHFPALSAKYFQRRPPNFLHVFGRAPSDLQLCFVQLKTLAPSARYSTFKYPMTLKPGLGVTQGHRKYTCRSDTHDLLLTFHSSHRPISHRFRDKRQFPSKIANFSYPPCIYSPR